MYVVELILYVSTGFRTSLQTAYTYKSVSKVYIKSVSKVYIKSVSKVYIKSVSKVDIKSVQFIFHKHYGDDIDMDEEHRS